MLSKNLPLLLLLILWPIAKAAAVRTNINNQTDDFKRSGVDLDYLHKNLKMEDEDFKERGEVFNSQFKGDKGSPNSREQEKERLSNLDADSLESRGRAAYNENKNVKKMFIDYNEPGFRAHRENAMQHKKRAAKAMNKLEDELSKGGIDCKEDEGYLETEQEFYLGTESKEFTNEQQFGSEVNRRERQGDVKYNKVVCEQAKKSYGCNNKLKARCARKGKNWHTHERRSMDLSGDFIFDYHLNWLYSHKVRERTYFHYLRQDYGTKIQVKNYIASTLGVSPNNIADDLQLGGESCWWEKNAGHGTRAVHKWKKAWIFQTYSIKYTYREGSDICLEWDKKWEERCSIR